MDANYHVTKLMRVIIPPCAEKKLDHIFLVMENGGVDLHKTLESADAVDFTEKDATRIIYQLLCSLNFLHSANLIHRDIKPQNILVDEDMNLKLCDLGLTR